MFEFMNANRIPYPVAWAKLGGGIYKDYGQYIIRKNPGKFMLYYYLPTAKKVFYSPSLGGMGSYQSPINIKEIIQWYNISEGQDMDAKHPIYEDHVVKILPISITMLWIIIAAISVIAFINRKRFTLDKEGKKIFRSIFVFGFIYYASTVFASPVETRYWLPMGAVQFSFIYILLNQLVGIYKNKEATN